MCVHLLDRAEERFKEVQRMYAQIAEWIAGSAILRGEFASFIGRINRAAKNIDRDHFPDLSAADCFDRFAHLGVEEQRVIDANRKTLAIRQSLNRMAVLNVHGQ